MNCAQCGRLDMPQTMYIGVNLHGETVGEPPRYCRECTSTRIDIINPPDNIVSCAGCGVAIRTRRAILNGAGQLCCTSCKIQTVVTVKVENAEP